MVLVGKAILYSFYRYISGFFIHRTFQRGLVLPIFEILESEIIVTVKYKVSDLTIDPSGAFHTDNITG